MNLPNALQVNSRPRAAKVGKAFNPKGGGGGPKGPGGFSIGCHFSQDDAMVTKILVLYLYTS